MAKVYFKIGASILFYDLSSVWKTAFLSLFGVKKLGMLYFLIMLHL